MQGVAGASGCGYQPRKGCFCPKDLPDADMLGFDRAHLATVAINDTSSTATPALQPGSPPG